MKKIPDSKKCGKCNSMLPASAFSKRNGGRGDGLQCYCKNCAKQHKQNRKDGVYKDFVYYLKFAYNLTVEQYNEILIAQNFLCATCRGRLPYHTLGVDHDHKCCPGKRSCGKCVRGILCRPCNCVIGIVNEDPLVLIAMEEYIVDWALKKMGVKPNGITTTRTSGSG